VAMAVTALSALPAWRLSMTGKQPAFELLDRPQATGLVAMAVRQNGDIQKMDVLTDAWDRVVDVSKSVYNVVSDGLNYALDAVVNGIKYVLGAAMDALGPVLNLAGEILDLIGEGIGRLHNLFLSLFTPWDQIKQDRNRFRTELRADIISGISKFSSPLVAARGYAGTLEGTKAVVKRAILSLETSSADTRGVGSVLRPPPIFNLLGDEVGRMIIEKLMNAMPNFGLDPPPPGGAEMTGHMAALASSLVGVAASLLPSMGDLTNVVASWILDGTLLTRPLDPLIDLLADPLASSSTA